jgi:CheY-like chemotaxis protein
MKTHVLIVDDNALNQKLVSEVLEAAEFSVSRAMDAIQAELSLKQAVPDLVLMDLALPGMDGLSLTRKLRLEQRFDGMPIVALTASGTGGDDRRAIDAGCDGYISKPIDVRTFATTVRAFLRSPSGPERQPL